MSDIADKPTGLAKLSDIEHLRGWASVVEQALGPSFKVDLDLGLGINTKTSIEEMKHAATVLMGGRTNSSQVIRVIDRFLGQIISQYAFTHSCSWAEAIQSLNLCETDGRSMRSLSRLPRIVERLTPDVLCLPDLTTKHFDQATAFQMPEAYDEQVEWNKKVRGILIEASQDPTERGSSWVSQRMRLLQEEFGISTGKSKPASELLKQAVELSYILMMWTEDDFDTRGITRAVVRDHYEALVNEALLRGMVVCPDNPITFVPFWEKGKEVEAV